MKTFTQSLLIALLTFSATIIFAQDNNTASHAVEVNFQDVTILDIEANGGSDIVLEADMDNMEAGEAISNKAYAENNNIWINWTVFAPEHNGKYQVRVRADQNMNDGWGLDLSVNSINAMQGGGQGENVSLTNADQQIIRDIDNIAWSGDGINKGANIKYELMLRDAAAISSAGGDITVTYTISAQ